MIFSLIVNKYFTIQRIGLWPQWFPWPKILPEFWKKYWFPPRPLSPPQPAPNRGPLLPPQRRL